MSRVWWGRESTPNDPPPAPREPTPVLLAAKRDQAITELRQRVAAFTPTWRTYRAGDAGDALVRLFAEQATGVLERVNRLPDKAFTELLRAAAIELLPATPARATLVFTVGPGGDGPAVIGAGFQVGAEPADDSDELVIFETDTTLIACAATIAELHGQSGQRFSRLEMSGDPVAPFGERPRAGSALLIGLEAERPPARQISFGVEVATSPGAPPPIARGSASPLPVAPRPLLEWEVLDGGGSRPLELIDDGTSGLYESGVVTLRLPRRWRPGRPANVEGQGDLYWLRLRIRYGRYTEPPMLSAIHLNAVTATATRTIRDEIPQWIGGRDSRRMRLSQTPILPGSLILEVDDGGVDEAAAVRRWKQVPSLAGRGPEDEVFTLDPSTGEIQFGDGVNGAEVPEGFRNVRAARYQVGGGRAGAADADAIATLVSSAPFVTEVTNPRPATGGADVEPLSGALRRGPAEIRARGRAVTLADYELMARRAPGAEVIRAHAVSGYHASYPGRPIPGVVGVVVVPADRGEGPPMPDEGTLRSVAEHLTDEVAGVAPAGVEVVAAAPRYHRVRISAGVVLDPAVDVGATVQDILRVLDAYLHPLRGGPEGTGWPFGAPLRYAPVIRHLFRQLGSALRAIPTFNFIVDGIRVPSCADRAISAHGLLWPEGHEVVPLDRSAR